VKKIIETLFDDHINIAKATLSTQAGLISEICDIVVACIKNGNRVLLFGNGGSVSDAQHIAAEFTGRFVKERRSLPL
jgi:D-sedoheptulose 7-phosphate isomerase